MLMLKELYELWRRDNLLTQALQDSHAMLETTHEMFDESVRSLRQSDDGEMRIDIYKMDQAVNRYEQKVRRKVLKHLVITGGSNVVPGLILTSMVIDIERVGDYTKNIMELAVAYPRRLTCAACEDDVVKVEEAVTELFNQTLPTLQASDKEAARGLIDNHYWLRQVADEITMRLVKGEGDATDPAQAAAVALYARYLKRVGAHLLNVLSSVVNPFEKMGFREDEE